MTLYILYTYDIDCGVVRYIPEPPDFQYSVCEPTAVAVPRGTAQVSERVRRVLDPMIDDGNCLPPVELLDPNHFNCLPPVELAS